MLRVTIAGGSGFIGRHLIQSIQDWRKVLDTVLFPDVESGEQELARLDSQLEEMKKELEQE